MDGLFGSPLVQTAIAVVGVWFVAALVCSGVVQLLAQFFGFKAKNLWGELHELLSPPPTGPTADRSRSAKGAFRLLTTMLDPRKLGTTKLDDFIALVPGTTKDSLKQTTDLNRITAIDALLGATTEESAGKRVLKDGIADTQLGTLMGGLPTDTVEDAERLRTWFGAWFDAQMELLRSAYRSKIRWYTAIVGLMLALVLHVDSIAVATMLYHQPTTRQLLIADVEKLRAPGDASANGCNKPTAKEQVECIQGYVKTLERFDVAPGVEGWKRHKGDRSLLETLLGIGITAGAIAAGAPFWFDVLRRMMGLKPKDPAPIAPTG